MALFLDLRASAKGGLVADSAKAWDDGTTLVSDADFAQRVAGRDLLLAVHGFNVDRADGLASLGLWFGRCTVPDTALLVGVLWPGDSRFLPFVDYVYEGSEAMSSGRLLADYLSRNAALVRSLSFCSHSLGARVVLETITRLNRPIRRAILMAPAIEDNCLTREYAGAAQLIDKVSVIASRKDDVLKWAFPPGNLLGEVVMHGHPYDTTPLGRSGPSAPLPPDLSVLTIQAPDPWDLGHLDYLARVDAAIRFGVPRVPPVPTSPVPGAEYYPSSPYWKPGWCAAMACTEFT